VFERRGRWVSVPVDARAGELVVNGAFSELIYDFMSDVDWCDAHLDRNVSQPYKDQPLAQDWARVAKAAEEVGEAIDALIGFTGQNPRKGYYGSQDDLLKELADGALSCIYAIQHFTKDAPTTMRTLMGRSLQHKERLQ